MTLTGEAERLQFLTGYADWQSLWPRPHIPLSEVTGTLKSGAERLQYLNRLTSSATLPLFCCFVVVEPMGTLKGGAKDSLPHRRC